MSKETSASADPKHNHFLYLDTPCRNCGRFGYIPGSMIYDPFNNTFCSPNCGWSFHLRPHQRETYRADMAASRTESNPQNVGRDLFGSQKHRYEQVGPSARKPPKHPRTRAAGKHVCKLSLDTGNAMFDLSDNSNWWF